MLGKVLSMVMGSANNPWKPTTQEEFDAMVADTNKVGNYIEYADKTYRVEASYFEGAFKVGETNNTIYFDITKKPSGKIMGTAAYDEKTNSSALDNQIYIKYLMTDDTRCTEDFFDVKLKRGLCAAWFGDNSGYAIIAVDTNGYVPVYDGGLIAYANKWAEDAWTCQFATDFTPTTIYSGYAWNEVFAYTSFISQSAKRYYSLSSLDNPAEQGDIVRGKQAYDSLGNKITGTHEESITQNPWKPTTEAEYKKLISPSNVGSFFDYNNKITRIKSLTFSGAFAVNDSITAVYFDTSKTPATPDFTSGYEEFEDYKLKYLFKTSAAQTEDNPPCGLFWLDDTTSGGAILYYVTSDGTFKIIYGTGKGDSPDGWGLDWNEEGDPTGFTIPTAETITEIASDLDWNGIYAFKSRTIDMVEYQEVSTT